MINRDSDKGEIRSIMHPEFNLPGFITSLYPYPDPPPQAGEGDYPERQSGLRAAARKPLCLSGTYPPPRAEGVGGGMRGWV